MGDIPQHSPAVQDLESALRWKDEQILDEKNRFSTLSTKLGKVRGLLLELESDYVVKTDKSILKPYYFGFSEGTRKTIEAIRKVIG